MTRYANQTSVSVSRSKVEIEETVMRYGATGFASGWAGARAYVGFEMQDRRIKFILEMPDPTDRSFLTTHGGRRHRTPEQSHAAWEQACRQRWRALALVIKAKLEAVESGITEFEDEFLAHILLPNGETAGQYLRPQIARAYQDGSMPPLLPDLRGEA